MFQTYDDVFASIEILDSWIESNGWAGYDPYDIQCASFLFRLSKKNKSMRKLNGYLFRTANKHFPKASRRFLRVKPQINSKGMGLFTEAYSILFEITKNEKFLKKAEFTAKWLLENPNPVYSNLCWGYPFDWQSKIFIPQGTPSGVATTAIGRGFWKLYQVTKNKKYLETCQSICNFILNDLNITENSNGICFSYTPLDEFQVHNANLFDAEFLVKIGTEIGNKDWVEKGLSSAFFSISEQESDGSLCYWSEESRKKMNLTCTKDHYHSGFEIRMLYDIWRKTKNKKIKKAADAYYTFYSDSYFAEDFAPILTPKGPYTIDIHSCAEALILNSSIHDINPSSLKIMEKTGEWIIKNMQMENGSFRYRLIKTEKKTIKNNMPYLRWGQAWMLLGLSSALSVV